MRGKQRARLRFQVSSPDGIREVLVHNCDYGVIRRFLAKGEKTFAQEFNLVHDRDHTLTLEVIDTRGRRAISDKAFLWSYKMSLERCGDNLNFLDGVGLWLRLVAASLVLLLPGALIARALRLRGASATVAWSLGALGPALLLVFVVHSSIWLALAVPLLALGIRGSPVFPATLMNGAKALTEPAKLRQRPLVAACDRLPLRHLLRWRAPLPMICGSDQQSPGDALGQPAGTITIIRQPSVIWP